MPIDVVADAVVSPANSFRFMDGGIDAVYTHPFGFALERRLQEFLVTSYTPPRLTRHTVADLQQRLLAQG